MKYEDLINDVIASEITKTGTLTFPLRVVLDSLDSLNKATLVRVLNKLEEKGKIKCTGTEDILITVSLVYYHELFELVNLRYHPLGKYTNINDIITELNDFLTRFNLFSNSYFLHYDHDVHNSKYTKQLKVINKSRKKFNKKFKKFYKKLQINLLTTMIMR